MYLTGLKDIANEAEREGSQHALGVGRGLDTMTGGGGIHYDWGRGYTLRLGEGGGIHYDWGTSRDS